MATARQRSRKHLMRAHWNRQHKGYRTVKVGHSKSVPPMRLHLESLGRKELLALAKEQSIRRRHAMTNGQLVTALMSVDHLTSP